MKIFFEIVPKLKKGTIVHVHDIFTPKDYPEAWLIEQNKFWNEQYLVEAIMMNKDKYEIYLMLNYLKNNAYKMVFWLLFITRKKHKKNNRYD